jgi:hypothetical protein
MSYASPTVVASGTTFAQLQAGGVSAHLENLITAQAATAAPTVAPTLSESGSGGTLPAATYYVCSTETNGWGETVAGPVSSGQAITLGQDLVITPPSLKTGNSARNYYVGTASIGPFLLAATGQTGSTTTISAPLPSNSYAVAPPKVNTTGLTYVDVNSNTHNKRLELLRAAKDGNLEDVYRYLRQAVYDFLHGNPMTFSGAVMRIRDAHIVFSMLATLCAEEGVLIDANPGTIGLHTDTIGLTSNKRTFP